MICSNEVSLEPCSCWEGYKAEATANGVICVGIYVFKTMPCNQIKEPRCECSKEANGILTDKVGSHCAKYEEVLLFIFGFVGVHSQNFVEDYCWRDYNGEIPHDALKCGTDRAKKAIYVGQVLYENKLIPGKIHENDANIHFEFYRAYTANETIKILCVRHPERFEWIQVKYYEVFHMNNKHLFLGGYEKGYDTYIGRAKSHGELTVGKVICSPTNCIRLTTIENGSWYDHDEFEILTYNPDAVLSHNPFDMDDGQTFVPYLLLFLMIVMLLVILFLILRRC
ncbi:hypothetical protein RN001_014124 [Aquatica leii]|uniref:Uncharacterized protein n=1 Tax=Aquatica leii TaxID=1421715 RepID=A0AAN7P156_9COLE|nr:hypothetical protein RN001_014124 [Aquatica leii]